ncbi:head GIN domain-containing protein [Emcibacter sp.]|uniref:head GIN domain-containing protein n=1 Tax=Emcibacter sp. TaxID=1979954 RepID=UPI002AA66708|nr:head GIN domain-containing protein [Emcibacter sp.]
MKKSMIIPGALLMAAALPGLALAGGKSYDLKEFDRIEIDSSVDFEIEVGRKQSVKVEASEETLERLDIFVRGHTLTIRHKRGKYRNWSGEKPEINISMQVLEQLEINGSADGAIKGLKGKRFNLELNGSGEIDLSGRVGRLDVELNGSGEVVGDKVNTEHASVEINGTGDVTLEGTCEKLDLEINGSGEFDGQRLKCKVADVEIMGSGDASVYASDLVDVEVIGSGTVDISGKPEKVMKEVRRHSNVIIREK